MRPTPPRYLHVARRYRRRACDPCLFLVGFVLGLAVGFGLLVLYVDGTTAGRLEPAETAAP